MKYSGKTFTSTVLVLMIFLSVVIISFSYLNSLKGINQTIINMAVETARISFQKDLLYRQWATVHGGVYVPVTEYTLPNPYLKHVDEQNITTGSGKALTLMNPAYMTRQVQEMAENLYKFKGHITSLNLMNPGNKPDAWERKALLLFDTGEAEFYEVTEIDSIEYLRYMAPMITEEGCLKCHAEQGYKVGDVRGGISVSVEMDRYNETGKDYRRSEITSHSIILVIVVSLLIFFGILLIRKDKKEEKILNALAREERKYRLLFENMHSGLIYSRIVSGTEGEPECFVVAETNTACQKLLNSDNEQLLGRNILHYLTDDTETLFNEWKDVSRKGNAVRKETYSSELGKYFVLSVFAAESGFLACTFDDVTEQHSMQQKILETLSQREVLLRELHHRTKNNMQVISSLLQLQAHNSVNDETKKILKEAEGRIESMALVHRKLYQTDNLSMIDLDEYIRDLLEQIHRNRGDDSGLISFRTSLLPVRMLIDSVVPLGLVVHEIVINSIKHRRKDRSELVIRVKMEVEDENLVKLEFSDNGPGLPDSYDCRKSDSLGMKLIFAIIENQLQGEVDFTSSSEGLTCLIKFKDDVYTRKV